MGARNKIQKRRWKVKYTDMAQLDIDDAQQEIENIDNF